MNKFCIHPSGMTGALLWSFACFAICLLPSASLGSATWPNEPTSSTKVLDWPFDLVQNGKGAGYMWDVYSSGRIVTDPTAPVSPSNVMKSSISPGSKSGGGEYHYITPGTHNEMFVGLMWRNNSEFVCRNTANKMWFMRGPGVNGFFGLQCTTGDATGTIGFGHNSGTLDNSHACAADLGLVCNPNINPVRIKHGTWTKLEAYIKKSTTSTSRDGIVRWWVNGILSGNYTNLNYAPDGLNEWLWSETWDGTVTNPIPAVEWAHYLDHLYISTPNCGSGGCAAPAYLVITSSVTAARTGTPYSVTLAVDGGTKPHTWFVQSGNLPAGLALNQSTGVISGTPTCVGRSDFTIRVTDASQPALTATKSYSIITSGTSTSCPPTSVIGSAPKMEQAQFTAKAVGGKVTFGLPIASSAQYRFSVYDLAGKKVYEHSSMGQREISVAKMLKNGVYLAKFAQGTQASTLRFSVMN